MKTYLLLSLIYLLLSCSKDSGIGTTAKIQISGVDKLASPGGIVIFGRNKSSDKRFQIAHPSLSTTSFELELSTGDWEIAGIIWEGPEVMTGASVCALIDQSIQSDSSINLEFKAGHCLKSFFSPSTNIISGATLNSTESLTGEVSYFKKTTFKSCRNFIESGANCQDEHTGMTRDFKLVIPSFNDTNGTKAKGIKSICLNMEDQSYNPNIPIKLSSSQLQFLIESYDEDDCNKYEDYKGANYGYQLKLHRAGPFEGFYMADSKHIASGPSENLISFADNIFGIADGNALIGSIPIADPTCSSSTHCLSHLGSSADMYDLEYNFMVNSSTPFRVIETLFGLPNTLYYDSGSSDGIEEDGFIQEISRSYLGPVNSYFALKGIKNCSDIISNIGKSFAFKLLDGEEIRLAIKAPTTPTIDFGGTSYSNTFKIELVFEDGHQTIETACGSDTGRFISKEVGYNDLGQLEKNYIDLYYKAQGGIDDSYYELYSYQYIDNNNYSVAATSLKGLGSAQFEIYRSVKAIESGMNIFMKNWVEASRGNHPSNVFKIINSLEVTASGFSSESLTGDFSCSDQTFFQVVEETLPPADQSNLISADCSALTTMKTFPSKSMINFSFFGNRVSNGYDPLHPDFLLNFLILNL